MSKSNAAVLRSSHTDEELRDLYNLLSSTEPARIRQPGQVGSLRTDLTAFKKVNVADWLLHNAVVIECCTIIVEAFGVTLEEARGKNRVVTVERARQATACILHKNGLSYPEIGMVLFRNHTTILHNDRTALRMLDTDPAFAHQVIRLAGDVEARLEPYRGRDHWLKWGKWRKFYETSTQQTQRME